MNLLSYAWVTSMRRDASLFALTATGAALCWLTLAMEQSLELPWWLPLAISALYPILSTILSRERWWLFLLASAFGAIAGAVRGFTIWPLDPLFWEGGEYLLLVLAALFVLLALIVGLAVRRTTVSNGRLRRVIWVGLACCVAYGPIVLVLTPPLVAMRVARNDRLAAERFEGLKVAVEQTKEEPGGVARICDGRTLKEHYSGPPFSDTDWRYMAGNFVQKDGYRFGIWIYCPQPEKYVVAAQPMRQKGDGTRQFCADDSGNAGCGMGTHEECLPCSR